MKKNKKTIKQKKKHFHLRACHKRPLQDLYQPAQDQRGRAWSTLSHRGKHLKEHPGQDAKDGGKPAGEMTSLKSTGTREAGDGAAWSGAGKAYDQ